jgi:ribosomal protein S14
VKAPPKKRAKVLKVYAPHEHFGSPLNVCRICGEKYAYVQKPHSFGIGNK